MSDLHKAEAAVREALARYWDGDEMSGIGTAVDDLLAALDAARGEAVAWRWPEGNWRDGEPSVYDLKELQMHAITPELAYAAPPAALAVPDGYALVPVASLESWRDAFAEELGAWDIDPPLHHVKTSHDEIEAMLAAARKGE